MFIVGRGDFFGINPQFPSFITFSPFTFSTGGGDVRRMCTMILIFPDNIYENSESFEADLALDVSTTGVTIDPGVIEVVILDDDGKNDLILATRLCLLVY